MTFADGDPAGDVSASGDGLSLEGFTVSGSSGGGSFRLQPVQALDAAVIKVTATSAARVVLQTTMAGFVNHSFPVRNA
jgi:hypothetical protein